MVYLILLIITFIILDTKSAIDLLKKTDLSVGEILAAFVFTGGLGYIFSIIYFGFYWLIADLSTKHIYNHLDLVKQLISSNKLKVIKPTVINSIEEEITIVDRRQAWYIVNVLWHSRTKISRSVEGVSEKLDSYYSDITTALATTLTGSVLSFVTFIILLFTCYESVSNCSVFWCIVIYVLFIVLTAYNFIRTYKAYQAMINTAFATEAFAYFEKKGKPFKLIFSK